MIDHQKSSRYTSFIVYLIASSSLGLTIQRHESIILMMAWLTFFFCYFWIVRMDSHFRLLLGLGILARLLLFFSMPGLSDDVYRFLWDGQLLNLGINPFQFRPEELIGVMDPELYKLLNSPSYYSVYPPFNQALFWIATKIGGHNLLFGTNILRSFLLLAEVGSVFLLAELSKTFNKSSKLAWWYFLNPLVILEIVGNVHFEGFVIFFLLLMLYALTKTRFIAAGAALGLAISAKLIPLLLLPFLALRYRWRSGLLIAMTAILVFGLTMVSIINEESLLNMKESLGLYSRKFEFNASFYFILREIGWFLKGYNPIEIWGPWLSFTTLILLAIFSIYAAINNSDISKSMLGILLIYLLMATTVHPWYVLTLLPLGLLSGYYFPVVWSFMVFITYLGYNENGFELSSYWIVVEYVMVAGAAIIEIIIKKKEVKNE